MNCNHKLFAAALLLLPPLDIIAQESSISEKQISLLTYPFSDPNPVPELGKIYPYFQYDGFSDKGATCNWKMVELENDYIKLWVVPEISGKILGAIEKSTGEEFIYYNHAVKFRDIAMRGPWTSGGIELNFGIIGHAPTCSTPADYLIRKNGDGNVSCFVGAIDLPSHTRWSVEINLPKDKASFTTRSFWDNPTGQEQSYYQWMNLGEYIFPGTYHFGHEGNHSPKPVDEQGRKINFYETITSGVTNHTMYLGKRQVFMELTGTMMILVLYTILHMTKNPVRKFGYGGGSDIDIPKSAKVEISADVSSHIKETNSPLANLSFDGCKSQQKFRVPETNLFQADY